MAIQANSLARLRALAEDPPAQVNSRSTQSELHEPLVLYIARVPGSQDIFLTTMKPRQKVVTAQDVESSLYYCHLHSSRDDEIRASAQDEDFVGTNALPEVDSQPQSVKIESNSIIHRKPVPPARKPTAQSPIEPALGVGSRIEAADFRDRSGRLSGIFNKSNRQSLNDPTSQPLRKLLGPRPLKQSNEVGDGANVQPLAGKENLNPRAGHRLPPQLPPRRNTEEIGDYGQTRSKLPPALPPRTAGAFVSADREMPPKLPERQPTLLSKVPNDEFSVRARARYSISQDPQIFPKESQTGFSVTLIRRDPGSGDQWNVGRITKGSAFPDSSTQISAGSMDLASNELSLEINTPGYDKFTPNYSEHLPQDQHSSEDSPFMRRLNMERQKNDPFSDTRRGSTLKPLASPTNSNHQQPLSFLSPWNGACKFETGLSGRTLKCRHFPFNSTGSADLQSSLGNRMQNINSSAVSELRFNLPGLASSTNMPIKERRPPLSAGHSRTSFFASSSSSLVPSRRWSRHGASKSFDGGYSQSNNFGTNGHTNNNNSLQPNPLYSEPPDDWDDAEEQAEEYTNMGEDGYGEAEMDDEDGDGERMDLSLGRERAGGGFGGKKAKLGKLIVEGEGLLMLDLVVAANMGIWWNARQGRTRKKQR